MLSFNALLLAKNHNFFGQIDHYMKEFSKIAMDLPNKELQQKLEDLLNQEIAIVDKEKDTALNFKDMKYKDIDYPLHPNVLA